MKSIILWTIVSGTLGVVSQPSALGAIPVTVHGTGSNNCLDVKSGNSGNGAAVDNSTCNGSPEQVFEFNNNGTITNIWGKCLDVLGANANAGVLDFTACNTTAAQQWQQNGSQITGLAGKCLDVYAGSSSPGATVDLATCNGTNAQNWQLVGLATLQGAGNNCLDVKGANPNNGAAVDNYTCNGSAAQAFQINANGTIVNFWGKCLDVLGDNTTAGVLDFTACNGTAAQQWQLKGNQILGPAGKCLDVYGGISTPGTTVDLAGCNGTPAQNWQIVGAPTALESVGTKCLDIVGGNTASGARLQIFECNRGTNAQIFTFTAAGEIRNQANECLDVIDGNAAAGEVQMTGCNGTASQQWKRQGRLITGLDGNCLSTVASDSSSAPVESSLDHTAVGLAGCNAYESQEWIASDLYQQGPATLLIVTSDAFAPTFTSFVAHKQAIGVSTTLLTMSGVRAAYPNASSDDALSLKYAIADYYQNFATNYVLLGGDNSQVPIRYSQVLDSPGGQTHSYRASDLYYANLYRGHVPLGVLGRDAHGAFDNWDYDGDGFYNTVTWNLPLVNPDAVDGFPDIAVGRIPAYNTTALQSLLSKIINYENLNPAYSGSGFPPLNQFLWAADACYGPASYNDIASLDANGSPFNNYAEEIGVAPPPNGSCNAPPLGPWVLDVDNFVQWGRFVTAVQDSQAEWITYVGHGGPSVWGYRGTFNSSQLGALSNEYAPVVFAAACQTSQIAYMPSTLPFSDPGPPIYDPNASTYSQPNIGSNWLFNANGGAVAYAGENIVLEDQPGVNFIGSVFQNQAHGYSRLGDMWRMSQQQYWVANYPVPGYDPNFSPPRIYLGIMALLGDPSMRTQ